MNKELKVVITADDRASGPIKNLENNLKSTQAEFGNTSVATQGFGGAITGSIVKANLLIGALKFAGEKIVEFGQQAIESTSNFQQSRVAFDTMLGSADKGAKLMEDISDFAMKTPFELPELVDGSKRLLAYNVSAEKIIPTMNALGNITAGVGKEKMPQLILAFGQVKAAGKLTGAELRQFSEAGVPLLDTLAKQFGVTTSAMTEMISDGTVGFNDVEKAIMGMSQEGGKFFGLMDKQSQTFGGRMSNISDQWGRLQRALMGMDEAGNIKEGGLFDRLSKGAELFMNLMIQYTPAIEAAFNQIGNALNVLGQFIGGAATEFWSKYGTDIMYILNGIWTFIKMVVDGIMWVWNTDFLNIKTITLGVLNYIWNLFKSTLDILISLIKFFVALFTGDWDTMWKTVNEISVKRWNYINALFAGIPNAIGEALKSAYNSVTSWFGMMWDEVKKKTDDIRNALKDAFDWNKKKSPSYNDLLSETSNNSSKMLDNILNPSYMSATKSSPYLTGNTNNQSVNINFNGNMSVRSDEDVKAIADEVKRIFNRQDILFAKGLY